MGCSSSRPSRENPQVVLATGIRKDRTVADGVCIDEGAAEVRDLILKRGQRSVEGRQTQVKCNFLFVDVARVSDFTCS